MINFLFRICVAGIILLAGYYAYNTEWTFVKNYTENNSAFHLFTGIPDVGIKYKPISIQRTSPVELNDNEELVYGGLIDQDVYDFAINIKRSPYFGKIIFDKKDHNLASNDKNKEYFIIKNITKENIDITHWSVENFSFKHKFYIPSTVENISHSTKKVLTPTVLQGDEYAIVNTSKSPTNVSFRSNLCSGFFKVPYAIKPSLNTICPNNRNITGVLQRHQKKCLNAVRSIKACETPPRIAGLSVECKNFIAENLTQASCTKTNIEKEDFFADHYRLFLEQKRQKWTTHDTLFLFDVNDHMVDIFQY